LIFSQLSLSLAHFIFSIASYIGKLPVLLLLYFSLYLYASFSILDIITAAFYFDFTFRLQKPSVFIPRYFTHVMLIAANYLKAFSAMSPRA